jgi:hypothetical protein
MAYFIFEKNLNNIEGTLYRIAENQFDLDNLNIIKSDYYIINDSSNFENVKLNAKSTVKYVDNTIIFNDILPKFNNKTELQNYVNFLKTSIKVFTDINLNHPLLNRWNSYLNQLNNLNLDLITYPLNKSLEQYFKDTGQSYFNILQLP